MRINNEYLRLMRIVNKAYGDDLVGQCVNWKTGRLNGLECDGDTLATFVARELSDTFVGGVDWATQCDNAITALQRAQDDLQNVIDALVEAHAEGEDQDGEA